VSAMSLMNKLPALKVAATTAIVAVALAVSGGQLMAAAIATPAPQPGPLVAAPAGPGVTLETVLLANDRPELFARSGSVRDALGFTKGVTRNGRHVHDGLQNSDYDEVAEIDAAGHATSLAQFDAAGNLVTAVRFDGAPKGAVKLTADAATKTAQRTVAAAGMSPSGVARTEANDVAGGWDIHWDRTQSGFKVRGDETSVHLWQDGRLQSVAHVEHSLAAAPAAPLGRAEALAVVTRQCDAWFSANGSGYSVQATELQWVGPNAAFDAQKLGAAVEPYRLAWVVNVKPSGVAAESARLVTLFVDAGNGSVIGGDVVE
jgi:hypothetical protein